jgi:hypothetical protein
VLDVTPPPQQTPMEAPPPPPGRRVSPAHSRAESTCSGSPQGPPELCGGWGALLQDATKQLDEVMPAVRGLSGSDAQGLRGGREDSVWDGPGELC